MALLEFLLNLAGLLLWINWRLVAGGVQPGARPATLIGTLRRAEPARFGRWQSLVALAGLLLARAGIYQLLGPALDWTGTLDLFVTRIAFRSDTFALMLVYSILSFGWWLGMLVFGVALLSVLARGDAAAGLASQLARAHLGQLVDWPGWARVLLPLGVGFTGWWLASWPLAAGHLIPRPASEIVRLAQAGLVGAGTYLAWKFVFAAVLALYWLQSHVYLGRHPVWSLLEEMGRRLMRPIRKVPLRIGQLDLRPLLLLALVLGISYAVEHGIQSPRRLDANGRPEPPAFKIPGLAALFEAVSR